MDFNAIEIKKDEVKIFNIGAMYEKFGELKDNRNDKGKRYSLNLLLTVFILAKLSGEDKPYGIAEWIKIRGEAFQQLFKYHRAVTPSHKTVERLIATTVEDAELQKKMKQYLHQSQGGQQSLLITLDGKALRGTIPQGKTRGVHLLAAYLPEEGLVLLQLEVGQKENEIATAPRLLQQLDLKGRVVTGDAMFTQRAISVEVLAGGGDYVWLVKENQPTLSQEVQRFFEPSPQGVVWRAAPLPSTVVEQVNCQSGRVETRRLTLIPDEHRYLQWPGLNSVFKLERIVFKPATQEKRGEVVYGITSLPYTSTQARSLLQWTRQHWGIENGLHYRRDVTLHEDATRMKNGHQAQVMATINNFIVALTSSLGWTNLASARRFFQAKVDSLLFATSLVL